MSNTLRLEIVLPRATAEFPRLPSAVRKLLPLCDGTRTVESLCNVGDLPEAETRRAVERLVSLGVVAMRSPRQPSSRTLSATSLAWIRRGRQFSDDEEAFFCSPIDHLIEEA